MRGAAGRGLPPWTTNKEGGDGFVLKFDMNGNFKMRVGGTPRGPDSNNTNGGINGTPVLYQATDMALDPATNRLYISDGYGNRHVVIIDAETGTIRQTLASPVGFSVVGLATRGDRVYASDVQSAVHVAVRKADGTYDWDSPIQLENRYRPTTSEK